MGLVSQDLTARALTHRMCSESSTGMLLSISTTEVRQAPVFPADIPFVGAAVDELCDETREVANALFVDLVIRSFHYLLQEFDGMEIKGFSGASFWEEAERIAGRTLPHPEWITTGIIEINNETDWEVVSEIFSAVMPQGILNVQETMTNAATLCRLALTLISSITPWTEPSRADAAIQWLTTITERCCFGEQRRAWTFVREVMKNRVDLAVGRRPVRFLSSEDCPYIWADARTIPPEDRSTRDRICEATKRISAVFGPWETTIRPRHGMAIARKKIHLDPLIVEAITNLRPGESIALTSPQPEFHLLPGLEDADNRGLGNQEARRIFMYPDQQSRRRATKRLMEEHRESPRDNLAVELASNQPNIGRIQGWIPEPKNIVHLSDEDSDGTGSSRSQSKRVELEAMGRFKPAGARSKASPQRTTATGGRDQPQRRSSGRMEVSPDRRTQTKGQRRSRSDHPGGWRQTDPLTPTMNHDIQWATEDEPRHQSSVRKPSIMEEVEMSPRSGTSIKPAIEPSTGARDRSRGKSSTHPSASDMTGIIAAMGTRNRRPPNCFTVAWGAVNTFVHIPRTFMPPTPPTETLELLWRRSKDIRLNSDDGRGKANRWLQALGRAPVNNHLQIPRLTWNQEGVIQVALFASKLRGDIYTRVFISDHVSPWAALTAYLTLIRIDNGRYKALTISAETIAKYTTMATIGMMGGERARTTFRDEREYFLDQIERAETVMQQLIENVEYRAGIEAWAELVKDETGTREQPAQLWVPLTNNWGILPNKINDEADPYVAITRSFVHPRSSNIEPPAAEMFHRIAPKITDWSQLCPLMDDAIQITTDDGEWAAAINAGRKNSITHRVVEKELSRSIGKARDFSTILSKQGVTYANIHEVQCEMVLLMNNVKATLATDPELAVCKWTPYRQTITLRDRYEGPGRAIVMDIEEAFFMKNKLRSHRRTEHGPLKMDPELAGIIERAWRLRTTRSTTVSTWKLLAKKVPPYIPMTSVMMNQVHAGSGNWRNEKMEWGLATNDGSEEQPGNR